MDGVGVDWMVEFLIFLAFRGDEIKGMIII
jgi:hypothetical protein